MKGKYFSTGFVRTSTPVINQIQDDKNDLAVADKDIVFDWVAIDIPKGTHRLISADMIVQGNHGARQAEVDLLYGDSSKARDELNWKPQTDFTGLVTKMVKNDLELASL